MTRQSAIANQVQQQGSAEKKVGPPFDKPDSFRIGGSLAITPDAFQPERGGKTDMFVGKLSADGRKLVYLTWFGGSGAEWIETEKDSTMHLETST